MKITRKILEKLIKEEVEKTLLSEQYRSEIADDINRALERNGQETAIRTLALYLKHIDETVASLINNDIKRIYYQVKKLTRDLTGRKF